MQYGAEITIWREVPNSKRGLTKISKRQPNYLTSEILFLTREHQSISSRNRLMFCLFCKTEKFRVEILPISCSIIQVHLIVHRRIINYSKTSENRWKRTFYSGRMYPSNPFEIWRFRVVKYTLSPACLHNFIVIQIF